MTPQRLRLVVVALAVTACRAAPSPAPDTGRETAPARAADAQVAAIVAAISEERLRADVNRLAAFGTRHTLSATTDPARGIGAARQWIHDELVRASPRLQVSFETHRLAQQGRITRPVELRNIVAVLPGRSPRRIYVTAHYDTVNIGDGGQIAANARAPGQSAPDAQLRADQDYDVDAPGANDNGSGTALTIELARVLAGSGLDFDATLVFVLWAGEEQGLFGSRVHAAQVAAGKVPVDAVFNHDIVGGSQGGDGVNDAGHVRIYSEGPEDSMSRSLARYIAKAGAVYVPAHRVRLMARHDRFARGSDHSSFNQHGIAAIVFREARENFSRQHSALDTVEGVDVPYLAQNARISAAAAASLALAPPAPRVTTERGQVMIGRQPTGYDANLRWTPSPGAVSYRVYWRDAWATDWQQERDVGKETSAVLSGMSIDDYVFGVAAVGPGGHESLISAYVSPPRRDDDVKLAP